MRIAVLGWGSLIWDQGDLNVEGNWKENGPKLPLEFCRLSSFGDERERVTLVIDEIIGVECNSLWEIMKCNNLDEAKANLQKREGCLASGIHFLNRASQPKRNYEKNIHNFLSEENLDAVIWTALKSNWADKRKCEYSQTELWNYLNEKKGTLSYIDEYFTKAPSQVRTNGRITFEKFKESLSNN